MRSEDLTSLFATSTESVMPAMPVSNSRTGQVTAFDSLTGSSTVVIDGVEMTDLAVNVVGAVPLQVGDFVDIDTSSTRWFIKGRVSEPGDGVVPTWPADIEQAAADAAAAQAAADALQLELDTTAAAVAAAEADIETLKVTTLPALQADLDAAKADVAAATADLATLTGTTIPALQAEVDGILPITETDISDDAITTPKLAANAVTALKIAANTITAAEIAAEAITASELAANAVTAGKIAAGTIIAADISAGAITTEKIAADAVTANEIAAGTITATEIAAGAVTGAKLTGDAIDGKTITGALFRTAATGQRIEIDSPTLQNIIRFYSGQPWESAPGELSVVGGTDFVTLTVAGPITGAVTEPNLKLGSLSAGATSAWLEADTVGVSATDTVINTGTLAVNADSIGLYADDVQTNGGPVATTISAQTLTNKDLTSLTNTFHGRMLTQNLVAACSSNLALQTTEADVTGATVTFSTTRADARYMCTASFYFSSTAASAGVAVGKLNVDGSNQAAFANFTGSNTVPDRVNSVQTWSGTLASAGSHTLKLRGVHSSTNSAVTINATHTTIAVMVFE